MSAQLNDARLSQSSMEGGGFYNRNSAMQAAGNVLLLPLWKTCCHTVEIGEETLVVVDYGSSQGRNSMAPMRMALEELRQRTGPERPVQIFHNDLASNDFSSLLKTLENEPSSYMVGFDSVFPSFIGRSYLSPVLPPASIHLGWNSWTMHWMSRVPIEIYDHILPAMSKSEAAEQATKDQQATDWRNFLDARSYEMRPGAKLLSAFTGATERGSGWEWLSGELWGAVLEMGLSGLLSEEEQRQITIPVRARTLEEVKAPFSAHARYADIELERAEIIKVPDPFWDEFQKSGDAQQLAQSHANTTRGWAGPSIEKFIAPGRDRPVLMNDLFDRFAQRIEANPKRHETLLIVVVLKKT